MAWPAHAGNGLCSTAQVSKQTLVYVSLLPCTDEILKSSGCSKLKQSRLNTKDFLAQCARDLVRELWGKRVQVGMMGILS